MIRGPQKCGFLFFARKKCRFFVFFRIFAIRFLAKIMIFGSPLYLFGLLAAAIPVAVHLFSFRRYKKLYFSDLSRIEDVQAETRKTSRLKQILVLVLRILAIVFLVIAFAKPLIPSGTVSGSSTAVCIYIDNSPSVSLSAGESEVYRELLFRKAKEIIGAYSCTDRFLLVDNDFQGDLHFGTADDALEKLGNMSGSSVQTLKLSEAASVVFDLLRSETSPVKRAYFLSSFDKSVADLENFPADTAIRSSFVYLENEVSPQVYIDTVYFSMPFLMPGSKVTASVVLKNPTGETAEDCELSLFYNDEKVAVASETFTPQSQLVVPMTFTVSANHTGSRVSFGSVQLAGNGQVMNFAVMEQTDGSIPVQIVSSSEITSLSRLYAVDSRIGYRNVVMAGTASANDVMRGIENSRFLILNGITDFGSELIQECAKFVKRGNGLLVLPPEKNPDCMNALLRQLNAPELAGFQKETQKVNEINIQHVLYRNVFEKNDRNFEKPVAKAHYKLRITPSSTSESILTFDNGDDFLFSSSCESGTVYVLTSPLSEEYTNFANLPLFVPTFLNMSVLSCPAAEYYRLSDNKSPVRIETNHGIGENEKLKLVPLGADYGDVAEVLNVRQFAGQDYADLPPDNYSGCYRVISQSGNEYQAVAFNVKPGSGIFYSFDELEQLVGSQNLASVSMVNADGKKLDEYIRRQNQGRPLWKCFLILSLLMLIAEIMIIRFYK